MLDTVRRMCYNIGIEATFAAILRTEGRALRALSMRAIGVICEFNPLHAGHVYLLRRMREAVGDEGCVIAVMSGRFVQRGEAASFDPYLRAEWAMMGGADLVLELPFPWSGASAEHFAAAGVHILSALGTDTLAFGSESGDATLLARAADVTTSPDFGERYAALCRGGMGTAAAFSAAIRDGMGEDTPADFPSPNDILGISYLVALKHTDMGVSVVRREGASYRDAVIPATGYPSATALRRVIAEAASDPVALSAVLEGTTPPAVVTSLTEAVERGDAPLSGNRLRPFFHAYYRLQTLGTVEHCAECGGGVAGHILKCAAEQADAMSFFDALRSNRYTDARLRRALLFGALGVCSDDLFSLPDYTVLLGANERGRKYLREWQKANEDSDFRVVTKPADAPDGRQCELSRRADALFTLCYPTPRDAGALLRQGPVII